MMQGAKLAAELLKVENLSKHFSRAPFFALLGKDDTVVKAVDGISFSVAKGEIFGLVGESGSGKSTAARMIIRLVSATSGKILFDGQNILDMSKAAFQSQRRRIQMVFQDPYTSLNPRIRVRDAIGTPLRLHRVVPPAEIEDRVIELLELVGLGAEHANRYPHEFSGGQRQRLSIARAMSVEPDLIVADEAVSALDVSVQAQILNLFGRLRDSRNLTFLFIAHDLGVVEHICDRVAVMFGGKIVEMGKVDDLFSRPQHPYTEALLSAIPEPDPAKVFRPRVPEGEPVNSADRSRGCVYCGRCPIAREICTTTEPPLEPGQDDHWLACHLRQGDAA